MIAYDKILGCLVGAAAGDAMGAATEIRTRAQIHELFGGDVRTFEKPPKDTFARGSEPGQVTDDFSVAYVTARAVADNGGAVTEEVAKQALLEWAAVEKWFARFAGPTTRAHVAKLKGEAQPAADGFVPVNENGQSTNGAAMKSSPIALFSGGIWTKPSRTRSPSASSPTPTRSPCRARRLWPPQPPRPCARARTSLTWCRRACTARGRGNAWAARCTPMPGPVWKSA